MERFELRNWDEFRWENEIRRDERRICAYFSFLPLHLDMPDEEEAISRRIAAHRELVPGENANVLHCRSYFASEAEDEEEDGETDEDTEPQVPSVFSSGELIIDMLDDLLCQWNENYISTFPVNMRSWGVNVACFYSRLLTRVTDFADACTSAEADPGLRTALAKFVLSDIRVLKTVLDFISGSRPGTEQLIRQHLKKISLVNDWTIHLSKLTQR